MCEGWLCVNVSGLDRIADAIYDTYREFVRLASVIGGCGRDKDKGMVPHVTKREDYSSSTPTSTLPTPNPLMTFSDKISKLTSTFWEISSSPSAMTSYFYFYRLNTGSSELRSWNTLGKGGHATAILLVLYTPDIGGGQQFDI